MRAGIQWDQDKIAESRTSDHPTTERFRQKQELKSRARAETWYSIFQEIARIRTVWMDRARTKRAQGYNFYLQALYRIGVWMHTAETRDQDARG